MIVTADHGGSEAAGDAGNFETNRKEVPFFVKLPRQTSGRQYDEPFSAVVVADLIMALTSQLKTADDVIEWLENHDLSLKKEAGENHRMPVR